MVRNEVSGTISIAPPSNGYFPLASKSDNLDSQAILAELLDLQSKQRRLELSIADELQKVKRDFGIETIIADTP
jgi:hypothetical protein